MSSLLVCHKYQHERKNIMRLASESTAFTVFDLSRRLALFFLSHAHFCFMLVG